MCVSGCGVPRIQIHIDRCLLRISVGIHFFLKHSRGCSSIRGIEIWKFSWHWIPYNITSGHMEDRHVPRITIWLSGWVRVQTVHAEDLSSGPSIHIRWFTTPHHSSSWESDASGLGGQPHVSLYTKCKTRFFFFFVFLKIGFLCVTAMVVLELTM